MFLGYIDPGTGYRIYGVSSLLLPFAAIFAGIFIFMSGRLANFFRKKRKSAVFLVLVILAFIAYGVFMISHSKDTAGRRVIVLGIDGMSPDIAESMMAKGSLPNFSGLAGSGSYSRLRTSNPAQSPVAWAVFFTGKYPGENGIFDFIVRNPKDYSLSLSLSDTSSLRPKRVLKARTVWQYLSAAGIPSVVVHCPLTFPPDRVNGRILSGMGVPDILGTEGTFTFYTTQRDPESRTCGGNVFYLDKSSRYSLDLLGPRSALPGRDPEYLKVHCSAEPENADSARIKYQGEDFSVKRGELSAWKPVEFRAGMKKIRGILRFYLVESFPEFKLYISPVNFDPRSPLCPISYPAGYSRELADSIGLYHTQGVPVDTWSVNENRMPVEFVVSQAREVFDKRVAILDHEMARFEKGLLFCYFGALDTIQHMFWPGKDNEIEAWYVKMDELLGRVNARLKKDDILIVLSDHGFCSFERAVHINSWLRDNGYLRLKEGADPAGRELLRDVDWTATRAYALGFGAVYLNLYGRERGGIVKPGTQERALKQEISEKLLGWKDPRNGKPVVNNVYRAEDIFAGAGENKAPDMFLGFNKGYRASWQTALGACPFDTIEDNVKKWSGDHLVDPVLVPGVLFSNRRLSAADPGIEDVPFSILMMQGYKEERLNKLGLKGKMLFGRD